MKWASQFVCATFVLHVFTCLHSLPVSMSNANRYKTAAGWLERSHTGTLKKRGRAHHAQDTWKEDFRVRGHHLAGMQHRNSTVSRSRPHCGVLDSLVPGAWLRQKRFVLFGERWPKTDLTYQIRSFPWQLSEDKVRSVLQEALRVWSDVTPLTFTEVSGGKADIVIEFERSWHGDNLPFDGSGGILAHAFFPRTQREGDIHFDYDETWTLGNDMGTDLLQVAAHEFGHVLGLQHSLEPGAIMSPFYSFSYPLALSEDDMQGIQYLYGKRLPSTSLPHTTSETNDIPTGEIPSKHVSVSVPDACRTDFDAISTIRGELFFFKSRYVWRIRDGRLQEGYPALASRHWRDIPESVDAALEDKSGNIWFFQGHTYWVYDAERQIRGPESVESLNLPVAHIEAALMWGEGGTQGIYFFKEGRYWRLDPQKNQVDRGYPRSTQDWWGLPNSIDAAFQDQYGYAHFFSGRQYWKFGPEGMQVLKGYPRWIGVDFFGCQPS